MRTIEIVRTPTTARLHEARMLWHQLGNQVAMMEARGYSIEQRDRFVGRVLLQLESGRLDEGLLDMLGGFLTKFADSSMSQGLKRMLGDKLVAMIGLDRSSFLGGVISNFIENTTASDLIALFQGSNKCKVIANRLASAMQEQIVEQLITGPLQLEANSGLGRTIVEAVKAQFVEGGPITKWIVDVVCGLKISELLPGVTGAGNLKDLGSQLQNALGSVVNTANAAVAAGTPAVAPAVTATAGATPAR